MFSKGLRGIFSRFCLFLCVTEVVAAVLFGVALARREKTFAEITSAEVIYPASFPGNIFNSGSKEELCELPGIGPALAEEILSYRATHGPFMTPEELILVHGIGEKKLAQLSSYFTEK